MQHERIVLAANASADVTGLTVGIGGRYLMEVSGSNFGSVALQKLASDGSTYVDIEAVYEEADGTGGTAVTHSLVTFTANGAQLVDLPPGAYKLAISSATAVYAVLTRIPLA